MGAEGSIDTTKIKQPIVGFVFGQKGLMAGAVIEGSKFTKLHKETAGNGKTVEGLAIRRGRIRMLSRRGIVMKRPKSFQCAVIWVLVLLLAAPAPVFAQDAQDGAQKFSQEQLDRMMAPVALYPDSLLAQILMAATYPLEVVMADRWVKQNRNLQGDQLNDALDNQNWDPSVKALVPFPDVLSMMSEKLEWTQMVGDAFLAQEGDVMDTVQQLRQKAYAADNLKSSEKQRVTVEDDSIRIEPANPEVVYVPAYDPLWVYGPWWWPGYPPYVIYPYWPGVVIAPGFIVFGVGCFVGASWGHVWGHWDWRHHRVFVNEKRNININRRNIDASNMRTTPWMHNPGHRRGVPYRDPSARERFRQINPGAVENRRPFRGFERSPGGAPGGPGRRSGGTMSSPGGAEGKISVPGGVPRPVQGRTTSPGAVSVPGAPAGRVGAPGVASIPDRGTGRTVAPIAPSPIAPAPPVTVAPPSAPRGGTVYRTPAPAAVRPGGAGDRNMDAFRGIGQGGEVRRESSWGATIRPAVPSGERVTGGVPGAGATRGGPGGRSPQGGRR
ncbi:MAG: DUF3300 domain-containing protein [Syntrophales bacterium]